jgi:hypothetical protein
MITTLATNKNSYYPKKTLRRVRVEGLELIPSRQMDLSGPGIDVKLKERKKERRLQKNFP